MNSKSKIGRAAAVDFIFCRRLRLTCGNPAAPARLGAQTSVRMKLLVVQVLNEMLGGDIDVRRRHAPRGARRTEGPSG